MTEELEVRGRGAHFLGARVRTAGGLEQFGPDHRHHGVPLAAGLGHVHSQCAGTQALLRCSRDLGHRAPGRGTGIDWQLSTAQAATTWPSGPGHEEPLGLW